MASDMELHSLVSTSAFCAASSKPESVDTEINFRNNRVGFIFLNIICTQCPPFKTLYAFQNGCFP
jgi:hypothetical protein